MYRVKKSKYKSKALFRQVLAFILATLSCIALQTAESLPPTWICAEPYNPCSKKEKIHEIRTLESIYNADMLSQNTTIGGNLGNSAQKKNAENDEPQPTRQDVSAELQTPSPGTQLGMQHKQKK